MSRFRLPCALRRGWGFVCAAMGAAVVASCGGDNDGRTLYLGGGSALAAVSPMPIFKGSSDVNDIPSWGWVVVDANKPGALPPKDNTTNAHASAYQQDGELIIYFGQDRFTANGTADIGFWFLKQDISLVPDDPSCPPTLRGCRGSFTGHHVVGDVLVLSAFTNGGAVDTLEVYEWVGSGGNAGRGALNLILHGTNADCSSPSVDPRACAIVNSRFEGGINLTALGLQGCFTSFLSETRSSSSLTAQLKDFAFGDFDVCSVAVSKTGPSLSKVGDSVTYSYEITNTGAMPMSLRSIADDKIGDLATQANAASCGALDPGTSCSFDVPFTIPADAADPYANTVTIDYVDAAESDPATATGYGASDSHSIDLFQPSIALAKTAEPVSKIGGAVHYVITLSNTSSADTPELLCMVIDTVLRMFAPVSIASGGSVVLTREYTVPPTAQDPLVNIAMASCVPVGFSNVLTASATHSVNLVQPSITLSNTRSADTPDMSCLVSEPAAGVSLVP